MKIGIMSNIRVEDLRYIEEGSDVKNTESKTDDPKEIEIDEYIGEVGKPEDPEISILNN